MNTIHYQGETATEYGKAWLNGVCVAVLKNQDHGEVTVIIGDTNTRCRNLEAAKQFIADKFLARRSAMLKDVGADVKGFLHDNRQIIYWMALIFLLDHFFFQGAFRDRLKGLAERMIGKVEKQIEAK